MISSARQAIQSEKPGEPMHMGLNTYIGGMRMEPTRPLAKRRLEAAIERAIRSSEAESFSLYALRTKLSVLTQLDFGQFAPRAGERVLQGQKIRQGILLLSRLGRDSKEIDAPHILHLQPSLTD